MRKSTRTKKEWVSLFKKRMSIASKYYRILKKDSLDQAVKKLFPTTSLSQIHKSCKEEGSTPLGWKDLWRICQSLALKGLLTVEGFLGGFLPSNYKIKFEQ